MEELLFVEQLMLFCEQLCRPLAAAATEATIENKKEKNRLAE